MSENTLCWWGSSCGTSEHSPVVGWVLDSRERGGHHPHGCHNSVPKSDCGSGHLLRSCLAKEGD